MSGPSSPKQDAQLPNVGVHELIEALNDPDKANELMKKHGWNRDDLLKRAEYVAKRISSGIANVSVV